jgi:uncharacterized protein YjbI with pentapeptide repeats
LPQKRSKSLQGKGSKHPRTSRTIKLLKRFWWAFVALIGAAITAVAKAEAPKFTEWMVGRRAAEMARIDAALDTVWSNPNNSKRTKALLDLSGAAKSVEAQKHLVGRLVAFVSERHPRVGPTCPSLDSLAAVDRNAVATIVSLSQSLSRPKRWLLVLSRVPLRDSSDALHFDSLDLSYVRFDNADLRDATFSNSCLFHASFEGAVLDRSSFEGANLNGSIFTEAHLDSVSFRGDSMRGAQLTWIVSTGAEFRSAVLIGARLDFARLRSASFAGAHLTCAYIGNARMDSPNLTGTDLNWAFLGGDTLASIQHWAEIGALRGAYMGGVHGLETKQLDDARNKHAYMDGDQGQWGRLRDQNCKRDSNQKIIGIQPTPKERSRLPDGEQDRNQPAATLS